MATRRPHDSWPLRMRLHMELTESAPGAGDGDVPSVRR
jgi:hypothetical protein